MPKVVTEIITECEVINAFGALSSIERIFSLENNFLIFSKNWYLKEYIFQITREINQWARETKIEYIKIATEDFGDQFIKMEAVVEVLAALRKIEADSSLILFEKFKKLLGDLRDRCDTPEMILTMEYFHVSVERTSGYIGLADDWLDVRYGVYMIETDKIRNSNMDVFQAPITYNLLARSVLAV